MPLFAAVAERLNLSNAYKTDSVHKLESSGSRTPFRLSRCISGKSFVDFKSCRVSRLDGPRQSTLHGAVMLRSKWGR